MLVFNGEKMRVFCRDIFSSSFSSLKTMSSCCGGKCGCGDAYKCGSSCGGCSLYPDLVEGSTTSTTMIMGFAPTKGQFEEFEMYAENGGCGCKCGDNCNCNPCKCGK